MASQRASCGAVGPRKRRLPTGRPGAFRPAKNLVDLDHFLNGQVLANDFAAEGRVKSRASVLRRWDREPSLSLSSYLSSATGLGRPCLPFLRGDWLPPPIFEPIIVPIIVPTSRASRLVAAR